MTQEARTDVLQGAKVALTGRFASMTQREVSGLIAQLGGDHVSSPGRHTKWLVVGAAGPPLGNDGQPTQSLKRARHLRSCGYAIEIIKEDAFLDRLGLVDVGDGVHQRYTVAQLSRILDVSRDRIRSWLRWGLIEPIETVHRLNYFDYQQVTSAKMLCDLVADGLPLARIREGLQRVQAWWPEMEAPLCQLSVLEENGRLLIRMGDGRLAEPSGQLQLDFDTAAAEFALAIEVTDRSTDDWFHEALECENQGDYRGAVHAYERAIEIEPEDPILHFNLGNVLYASQELTAAERLFRRAVELDSEYVEAWNNLGTVLAESDQYDESILALRHALNVFPLYADAHFNLGDILSATGQRQDAQVHWRKYLQLDPRSPWADDVRQRLAELEVTGV